MANNDAIQIRQQNTGDGAILFDAAHATQAGAFDPAWFEPTYWQQRGTATAQQGGRGGVTFVRVSRAHHTESVRMPDADVRDSNPPQAWVIRHYRRGGAVASVMGDRYLFTGAEQTRSFAEMRLLAELVRRGLDVPAPIAARYRRSGVHYRADLITAQILQTRTLADLVGKQSVSSDLAARVGSAIAVIHAAGVYHADLNAHNILLDERKAWIIDFDRGELRTPIRAWQLANLNRLQRSLLKLGAAHDGEAAFERHIWKPLFGAYESALERAMKRGANPGGTSIQSGSMQSGD